MFSQEVIMQLGEIIINRPAKQLNKPLTYEIPESFGNIPVGTRVAVPLGASREEGILVGYSEMKEMPFVVKPILSVLDPTPWFSSEMLATARKLSEYYLCTFAEALSLFTVDKSKLKSYDRPKIEWLVPSSSFHIGLFEPRKQKQRLLAQYLLDYGPTSVTTLRSLGFSAPVIKQVKECSHIDVELRYEMTKTRYEDKEFTEPIPLSEDQEQVYAPIHQCICEARSETFLLHGVTGSGKTQIYLKAVQETIQQDKIAIVLVPEIALTTQIVKRFVERFGQEVVVFHSQLTKSERYNNWERLRRKDSHIIIGARSAVFAPTEDIGLIVVDEEHDPSYKQQDMTRYDARMVARWRSEANHCPLLFGSATPSVQAYYKAQQQEYTLLSLPHRIFHQPMPKVQVIDMKEEMFYGNYSVFSASLTQLIQETLEKREQIILLLNRRGHSTFIMCRECGKTIQCPHCDISMVYHQAHQDLQCHYCDHHEKVPHICPHCGSKKIKFFGTGTQKVEEELQKCFPQARIARLDQDTTSTKGASERILGDFGKGAYDILLGTQMVAKGHDFLNVTAVGVITADSVLYIPVYTAAERTFNLLTQAAGRAGRGKKSGHVVIQTYNPDHYAIIHSTNHDYESFYKEEMIGREALQYPPIGEMIQITLLDTTLSKVKERATELANTLRKASHGQGIDILGPYENGATKIRDMYRLCIMIRGINLQQIKSYMYHSDIFTMPHMYIDVDPV